MHFFCSVGGGLRNARFALRSFRMRGAYVFAIAVLAVGVGMTTALFSLVQAVLLQPLPFPEQDSLRVIWKADPENEASFLEMAYPELGDLQENIEAFESTALMITTTYGNGRVIQSVGREPVQVESAPVSHDFFRTLGVKPVLGQDFPHAEEASGGDPVVILSDRVWRENFNADRAIVGQQITLDGRGHSVIGVMASDVDFPRGAGLWVLLGESANRQNTWLQAIARVKPGYSDGQVNAEVSTLFARLAQQYPQFYSASQEAIITKLSSYWTKSSRVQLVVSLGASFLLLLAACATAGNLLLSRALARQQEIATRTSLGASTLHIVTQFGTEGLVAGLMAGTAGLAVAWGLIRLLVVWAPAEIPRIAEAGIDKRVLLFAGAVSLGMALAASIAPTWMASRLNLNALLSEGGGRLTSGLKGRRVQGVLTVAQTGVTVVLLAAALLIAMSFHSMLNEDIGFQNQSAVTMNLRALGERYTPERTDLFYTQLLDRLTELPTVTSAGAVLLRPLEGEIGWDVSYRTELDGAALPHELPRANFQVITPGYLKTIGTPVLEGRDVSPDDREAAEKVALISRSLAERLRTAGRDPIGSTLDLSIGGSKRTIVGVVADARYRGVRRTNEDVYIPYLQTNVPIRYPVIAGTGTPAQLADLVRREAQRLDPGLAVADVATIAQLVDRDTALQRFNMVLLLVFASGALLLGAAGVYAVVAENVSERRREIAIRMALGSDRHQLARRLVASTLKFVIAGETVGLLVVLTAGRSLSELLYEVDPRNGIALGSVLAFLLFVSIVSAALPAWAATGREPRPVLQGD